MNSESAMKSELWCAIVTRGILHGVAKQRRRCAQSVASGNATLTRVRGPRFRPHTSSIVAIVTTVSGQRGNWDLIRTEAKPAETIVQVYRLI